ncbi:PepSY domain-containing protein [Micromonospora sp. NPDC050686]|uniref:PepSY domain-containing protein n=1 Tax=Micromonospora sp. NPDC050686 TaxID=3154631 RepID=UPI00340A857F
MTRTALVLLATGAVAAVTGTALGLGAAAADTAPAPAGRHATVEPGDDRAGRPDDHPTNGDDAAGRPDDHPTNGDDAARTATRAARPAGDVPAGASAGHDRAVQVALARTGGGRVVKVEAGTEHGRAVWSVRIVRDDARLRVDVDAATGRVLRAPATAVRSDDGTGRDDHGGRGGDDHTGDDHSGRGDDDHGDRSGDNHGGHGDDD